MNNVPCKKVGFNSYFHVDALPDLQPEQRSLAEAAIALANLPPGKQFNILKLTHSAPTVTLLDYPQFFDEGFPVLVNSWTVDVSSRNVRHRTYADSFNPPILHRKELLLTAGHPRQQEYRDLTNSAEQLGLFDDPNRIGFKRAWDTLLVQRGYTVSGHQLIPIANDELAEVRQAPSTVEGVSRHLTALTRYGLSAPIQALARFGYLDGSKAIFDYGCGRGDDIRGLRENNIDANGWDPYFASDNEKRRAALVNLGFVINVIEDIEERSEALRSAYALADELLVVAAMLANQDAVVGTPYSDGVLTSRNTFQKYYTQAELRHFVAVALSEEPIPVGPGVFFVFKDKDAEQRFMYGRLENRRNILRLSHLSRPDRPIRVSRADAKYEAHKDSLEALWELCLSYGRDPERTEIQNIKTIAATFGSLSAAVRFIKSRKENVDELLTQSRQSRIDDLRVYFAQLQFEKRKPYKHLEARLQMDIRRFFGDYRSASEAGRQLLFQVAEVGEIGCACHEAAQHGIGWLEDNESLQLHTSLVEQLPPVLKAYIHCGTHLYGDVSSADLLKIHIRSGKLSLMRFDDFVGKPLPKMIQRVKINLRKQDMEVFDYTGVYEPPYLYRKSRFINEEFPQYAEQVVFEEALDEAHLMDFSGYGLSPSDFVRLLDQRRYTIEGFSLTRSKTIPNIDSACGRYLTYRQLIQCGETQARTKLPNLPKEPDSYTALLELARNILDPVIEYYGSIRLTYGFCSPELAKNIQGRIAPELDQHAAYEKKRNGKYVCERLGAACDFFVEHEDMQEVAEWVALNTKVDRLYFYGKSQAIHVSFSQTPSKQFFSMLPNANGRRIPKKTFCQSS